MPRPPEHLPIPEDADQPADHRQELGAGALAASGIEISGSDELQPGEIVECYERQGWVAETPDFSEQVADTSRTATFRYIADSKASNGRDPTYSDDVRTMTEHEGLAALDHFLAARAGEGLVDGIGEDLSELASDIRANMNFIGDKEYAEAVGGIKTLWQSYLDKDPSLQLCVPSSISDNEDQRKSDQDLIEQVLARFSDEERRRYGRRLVTDIAQIDGPPERTKIIVTDDWTMTGRQISNATDRLLDDLYDPAFADSLEVNLVAASPTRLEQGALAGLDGQANNRYIPVKAYYRAREAAGHSTHLALNAAPTSGLRSSVDHGFELAIEDMVKAKRRMRQPVEMPPLTNIVREYRFTGLQPDAMEDYGDDPYGDDPYDRVFEDDF